ARPAPAADAPAHEDKPGAVKDARPAPGHGGGQGEQINIFNPALDLGLWSLVVFLLLLFILTRYAWGPMLEGLRKREQGIHEAIREAERTREEAHRLRDQLQAEVNNAHVKVRE